MTLTQEKHITAIKKYAFRGKIEEMDYIHSIITIKVPSRRSKILLEKHFKTHGRCDYTYKIKLLGWFECWVPLYQIARWL
ncbi:hypothetical protein KAR91_55570 [Candidatus Pacearchaeota archaeon]|nr:hypothetical protein [Candidatus Pacearchaeota archaeon]